jgi:hypothetical protein
MKYNVKRHAVVQPHDQSIKLIPLTKNQTASVDAGNYDWLIQWSWQAQRAPRDYGYYAVRIHRGRKIYMHRAIFPKMRVDHWNRNGLDNRIANLRPCSQSMNIANAAKRYDNKSGYKGVHPNRRGTWTAAIKVNYRQIHLGTFPTKETAARAYDAAAVKYFGEFAHLNFPSL